MRLYRPKWKAADGNKRKSKTWWLDFPDANGRRLRIAGLTDKRQTAVMASKVETLVAVQASGDSLPAELLRWLEAVPIAFRERLAEFGLIDRERVGGLAALVMVDDANKIIGGHLANFLADAKARGVSPTQRQLLGQRCRDVLDGAKARWLRDLTASRVQAAIAAMADPTEKRPRGLSKQSLQHYVRAIKQFARWLHRERRIAENPIVGLKGYNAETDRRHQRRGFAPDEMTVLLAYTQQAKDRWGMSGLSRAAAYHLAFASGLRRNEIRTLTIDSFDLAAEHPTVTVQAAYSKHRKTDVQPIPVNVADALAIYLASADPDRPFALPDKTGKMLHEDMAGARQAWIDAEGLTKVESKDRQKNPDFLKPRDSRELVLDFHSFRHGYVTAICRANISPRVMMELARHSDPRLTMKRYSRVAVSESARALDALPQLTTPVNRPQAEQMKATGTCNATPGDGEPFAKSFAKSCGSQLGTTKANRTSGGITNKPKALQALSKPRILSVNDAHAPVAQLDSASVFGTEGWRFESSRV